MSVYKEKDQQRLHEKRSTREASSSRKPTREESRDRRPIITQEKPIKPKSVATASKEKGKTSSDKVSSVEKAHKRRSDGVAYEYKKEERKNVEKEGKSLRAEDGSSVRRRESVESKIRKESKADPTHGKGFSDKKLPKRTEGSHRDATKKERVEGKSEKMTHPEGMVKRKEVDERRSKNRRDRTRTRTLSPTEVKQLIPQKLAYELASGDRSKLEERSEKVETRNGQDDRNEEGEGGGGDDEYEDDFEEYESDFEEDDESESSETGGNEKSVESLKETREEVSRATEEWRLSAKKKEIEEIKKSIEKENYELNQRRKSVTQPIHEPDLGKNLVTNKQKPSQVIDFSVASRRLKRTQEAAATKRRGEELLSMISLDAISYSVLEIPPIPYDEFMRVFGKSNRKQVHVQTNEDDLDEEIQTDEIIAKNKWTQNPPEYLETRKTGSEISYVLTKQERLGVGGDVSSEEDDMSIESKTNGLWNFLSWASQVHQAEAVLIALERQSGNFLNLEDMPNHSKALAFGDGFAYLNVGDISFLKGRSISHLCLLPKSSGKLLSVHVKKEKGFQKTILCVWSFRELSKPLKILVAPNRVTSCSFGPNQGNLVFGGLSDGSICLWDLRESSVYHGRTGNSSEWNLQSPTYTTAGSLIEEGHSSSVVAIRVLTKVERPSAFGDFTPVQICSLEESGTIVIWSVVQLERSQRIGALEDLGLAPWGRVKLVKNSSFYVFASIRDEIPGMYLTSSDVLINESEDDGFYVANNLGSVHHCSSYGSLMKPKYFVPSKQDAIVEATCLESCPLNGNYFLVGCGDGSIRLHSRHQEKPLICLNVVDNDREAAIVSLSWMHMRPCVFFALDSLSRIHIWNLAVSDMYPEMSLILTEKKITSMKVLPVSDPSQVPFVIIGTEDGSVEVHRLKKEYGCRTSADVQNEMRMFLKYVSIL